MASRITCRCRRARCAWFAITWAAALARSLAPDWKARSPTRLSQAAGAPVKLMLTRLDESLAVGNRPSTFQKVKLGASADGMLLAYEIDSFGCPGFAAGGATAAGGSGATFPAPYIYKVPNTRVKQASVAINAGSSRAFRAPGHPTASFSMEAMMDDLAVKLGIDPVELRIKNDPFEIRQKEYQIGREKFGWKEKYKKPGSSTGVVKTGRRLRRRDLGRRRPRHASRGADQSRRQRRGALRHARHRHRCAHRRCDGRGGSARPHAGENHGPHRRHAFSAFGRQRRQHDDAFRFTCRFSMPARTRSTSCRRSAEWPTRAARTGPTPARRSA